MKGLRWVTGLAAIALVAAVGIAAAEQRTEAKPAKAKGGNIAATLEANERAMWEAFKNRDGNAFLALMDKDGTAADAKGFMPVSSVPEMLKDYELRTYTLRDFKATMVSKDVYLLTYAANSDASYRGQSIPPYPTYISTVYVKRGAKWLGIYHQQTMAMPPSSSATSN